MQAHHSAPPSQSVGHRFAPPPPPSLCAQEARERCAKTLQEVERRFPKGLPLLDPEEDMKIEVGWFHHLKEVCPHFFKLPSLWLIRDGCV